MKLEFREGEFAILTDWRNPFTDGIHGDWRNQVRHALANPKTHRKLSAKLAKFAPFVLAYTKILEDKETYLEAAGLTEATVCVISSSGEHLLTPWMIVHNIGHTIISRDIWIKNDIMALAGLSTHDDSVLPIQQELVDCASSRARLIPNLNEVIYELFTTWVWFGKTRSGRAELAAYCDTQFPKLFEKYRNTVFWHKYRHPIRRMQPVAWLQELISGLEEVVYTPGVPGFTTKVLKAATS